MGVPVNFNNTSTPNGLSTIVSNAWDFGDGALSMQVSPSHTFTTAGTFTVTLVVTNSNGTVDAEIKTGYINPDITIVILSDTIMQMNMNLSNPIIYWNLNSNQN